nr:basic proline-rich protein-like [Meriones unguiculatus]
MPVPRRSPSVRRLVVLLVSLGPKGLLSHREASTSPLRLILSPPPSTAPRDKDPSSGPGRAGKRPAGPDRGGGSEEGARRSSSTSSVSQSRSRRRRQSFPPRAHERGPQLSGPQPPAAARDAGARRDSGLGPPHPGARGPRLGPASPAEPRNSPPEPPAGCARRGVRRPLRARPVSARRGLPSPRRWVWRSRSCYPETEGRKNCARCPPLPPRRCHRWEQRRQSRVGRPGLRSFHTASPRPRPSGRPPPARCPGQAGSSREPGARPQPPGIPHSRPAGPEFAKGPGLGADKSLSLGGGCCSPAVAMATRTCSPGAWAVRPAPPGLTCGRRGSGPSSWPHSPSAGGCGHGCLA